MKKIHDLLIFCADRIDILKNFAAIKNVVIKSVQCIIFYLILAESTNCRAVVDI